MDKKNTAQHGGIDRKASANHTPLPRKGTVTARILSRLLAGNSLTQLDATRHFHTTRLSGIIHELRHTYGYNIITKDEKVIAGDGHKATIARYSLAQEATEGQA